MKRNDYLNSYGLVNGNIPKGSECQLKSYCHSKQCHHLGTGHGRDFSCNSARVISMIRVVKES